MVVVSYSGKEINAKLVYYGPGLSGKTTNLEHIYQSVPQNNRGKMVSMKTRTERTLFFDALLEGADEGLEEAVATGGNRCGFVRPDRVGTGEVHPLASIATEAGWRNADSEVMDQRRVDGGSGHAQ